MSKEAAIWSGPWCSRLATSTVIDSGRVSQWECGQWVRSESVVSGQSESVVSESRVTTANGCCLSFFLFVFVEDVDWDRRCWSVCRCRRIYLNKKWNWKRRARRIGTEEDFGKDERRKRLWNSASSRFPPFSLVSRLRATLGQYKRPVPHILALEVLPRCEPNWFNG